MMKKTIKKLIIASAMFGTIFSVNTSEAAVLMGDANGDGKVDAKDVQTMNDYKHGKNVYINISNADVYEQDGKITLGDIYLLEHYLNYYGDADGNGKVNNADVEYIRDILSGKRSNAYRFICDLNGDAKITGVDLVKVQNVVAKKNQLTTVDSKVTNQVLGGVGHSPEGVITSFSSPANNQITLTGKVWDRDAMDKPVTLQVYIGNDLGGSARFTVAPNKIFTYTYNVKNVPGKQAYTVYAIDEYGNNRKDAKIASGTVYVNGNFEHRPQGVITSFYSPAANQITLTGKVYDMDDMNKNIELHVYIGNDLGGSDKFTVCPNQEFTHTYNVKNVPGRQAYTVWAIDDYGPNRENSVIGRGTVDVKTASVPSNSTSNTNKIANALSWLDSNLGRTIGVNYQCVSTVKAYAERLGLPHPVDYGNARDYAYNKLNSGWTRVPNGVPQAGDILVYCGGKYGHVAIYAGNNIIYESNMSDKVYGNNLRKRNRAYNKGWYSSAEGGNKYYWGYIRPNV